MFHYESERVDVQETAHSLLYSLNSLTFDIIGNIYSKHVSIISISGDRANSAGQTGAGFSVSVLQSDPVFRGAVQW